MEKISTLKTLFIEHLKELYNAENQQIYFLQSVINRAENKELKRIIQLHILETRQQKKRLKNILRHLFVSTIGAYSEIMTDYIQEAHGLIERSATTKIKDAVIITSIQYMKHFEIACYGTAHAYAEELDLDYMAEQLYSTLKEEREMNNILSEIALDQISTEVKTNIFS